MNDFSKEVIKSFIYVFERLISRKLKRLERAFLHQYQFSLIPKGLDRAKFGEYTVVMELIETFSVCYLFKGQPYVVLTQ